MKKSSLVFLTVASLCAVAVTSCKKESPELSFDSRFVTLRVDSETTSETKSVSSIQKIETFKIEEDGVSLFITASKEINNDKPFSGITATKGSDKTSVSEGFTMHMLSEDASNPWSAVGTVKKDNASATYWSYYDNGGNKIAWPEAAENGTLYSFVSCIAPSYVSFVPSAVNKADYLGLVHTDDPQNENYQKEALATDDVIVAYTPGARHDHDAQNLIDLHFYHPVASVRFYVTSKVSRITLTNVKKGGELTYTGQQDFTKAFSWDTHDEDPNNITKYTQVVDGLPKETKNGVEYSVMTFYLVPQVFNLQDLMVTVDVTDESNNTHQITTKAKNLGSTSWDPGYRYNYYIDESAGANVGVDIVEPGWEGSGYTKKTAQVQNTMRSTAFVRATVVANWSSMSGERVIETVSIPDSAYNTVDWSKGSDGYWYYNHDLRGFDVTEPLISNFNNPQLKEDTSHGGMRFVMTISAQAVEADDAKEYVSTAWSGVTFGTDGTTIKNYLIYR